MTNQDKLHATSDIQLPTGVGTEAVVPSILSVPFATIDNTALTVLEFARIRRLPKFPDSVGIFTSIVPVGAVNSTTLSEAAIV